MAAFAFDSVTKPKAEPLELLPQWPSSPDGGDVHTARFVGNHATINVARQAITRETGPATWHLLVGHDDGAQLGVANGKYSESRHAQDVWLTRGLGNWSKNTEGVSDTTKPGPKFRAREVVTFTFDPESKVLTLTTTHGTSSRKLVGDTDVVYPVVVFNTDPKLLANNLTMNTLLIVNFVRSVDGAGREYQQIEQDRNEKMHKMLELLMAHIGHLTSEVASLKDVVVEQSKKIEELQAK